MMIKVCGLKQPENIYAINHLKPDLMGFIFYPKSKRFIDIKTINSAVQKLNDSIKKVAVFVNENAESIHHQIHSYGFDYVQLHGNESPQTVSELKTLGYGIIKAFSIKEDFDFAKTHKYENLCNYFLFDTATPLYGGSGKKFNWDVLAKYSGKTPFLLSGGINNNDINDLKNFTHPQLKAVDVNSGFEVEPGLKDVDLLKKFIKEIRK